MDKLTSPPAPYNDPYYDVMTAYTVTGSNSTYTAFDGPFIRPYVIYNNNNTAIANTIGQSDYFQMYLNWVKLSSGGLPITYTLGYMIWYVNFRWVGDPVNPNGIGDNSSSAIVVFQWNRTHVQPVPLIPTIANDMLNWARIN